MKRFKVVLGCLLFIMLTVTVFSGCGKDEKAADGEGNIKFTYWVPMPKILASHSSTMADITMYKELAKKTNIEIDFKHPPVGQEQEQFNLMIASRDLTDFIEYGFKGYPGGADKAIDDGIILKLNDLIKTSAPNFEKQMNSNDIYRKQSKSDRGDYYGFPALNVGDKRTFGGLMIRQDMLDELNLEVPQTINEWEFVLKELKNKKNVRAPFTGGKTMFSTNFFIMTHHFNGAFDVGLGYYMTDDKVKFGPMEPEYKEFLITMNRWFKEGLLDNEYSTNSDAAIDSNMINGDSAACYGYAGGTLGRYMTAMRDRDPNFYLVGVQHPVMNKGDEPRFMERQKEANDPFLSITTACKYPDIAAKWADFFYSEEGKLMKNYGIEGLTYTMENGEPEYTDLIKKNPDGLSDGESMAKYFRANYPSPGFNQAGGTLPPDLSQPYTKAPHDALITWSKYSSNAAKTLIPPISLSLEESQEYSAIMTDVETYCNETILKFVHGYESFDNYDKFIAKLKDLKIDRAIEINQTALNRYNSH